MNWNSLFNARIYRLLLGVTAVFCAGCGRNLDEPVTLCGGGVSLRPPIGWVVVDEKSDTGSSSSLSGKNGTLNVTVFDAPISVGNQPEDLIGVLAALEPNLKVTHQKKMNNGGEEFAVSFRSEGDSRQGAVYIVRNGNRLCIMTYAVKRDILEEHSDVLDSFRESAATLSFLNKGV